MRQYESIWLEIKRVDTGKEVPVRIHASARKRLIQAVKLEKTKEVAPKKQVGMFKRQGPLKIRVEQCARDAAFVVVFFSLTYDASKW